MNKTHALGIRDSSWTKGKTRKKKKKAILKESKTKPSQSLHQNVI